MHELIDVFNFNLFLVLIFTALLTVFLGQGVFKLPSDTVKKGSFGICGLVFVTYLFIVTDGNLKPVLTWLKAPFGASYE